MRAQARGAAPRGSARPLPPPAAGRAGRGAPRAPPAAAVGGNGAAPSGAGKTVTLLDYGAGNVRSVRNAIAKLGFTIKDVSSPADIASAERLIFPGVGSFGTMMDVLRQRDYLKPLEDYIAADKPFFGICLGMQVLFEGSDESGGVEGLGLIAGRVGAFDPARGLPVPHIGWNSLRQARSSDLLAGAAPTDRVYFVHSFRALPTEANVDWVLATSHYGEDFVAAVAKGAAAGTQFHPEKSGLLGLEILRGFLDPDSPEAAAAAAAANARTLAGLARDVDAAGGSGLARRVIACLDVRANDAGDLVVTKGDQYDVREDEESGGDVRNLGKPVELAARYFAEGADEVAFLNITGFRDCPLEDLPMLGVLQAASERVFVPLTVAAEYFRSGADKVSIGSDAVLAAEAYYAGGRALDGSTAIEQISAVYGKQAVVVSIDPRRVYVADPGATPHACVKAAEPGPGGEAWCWWQCTVKGGREGRDIDVIQVAQAVEAMGAGEIMLNCIDNDGRGQGFDLGLVDAVSRAVTIPVIASSGAGAPAHFTEVFKQTRAAAALAAGIFHREEVGIDEVKAHMAENQLPTRLAAVLMTPFAALRPVMPARSGHALARHALALAAALALLLAAAPAGGAAARGPRRGLLADGGGSRSLLATTTAPAVNCTPGSGVSAGGGECAPCERGRWSRGGANAVCRLCGKGYNTAGPNATSARACSDCRAGYGRPPAGGRRTCALCSTGTWRAAKPGAGIKVCQVCPVLTTTSGPGAKSAAACNVTAALDDPIASALLRGALELGPQFSDRSLASWRPGTDPCTWQGIMCTDSTPRVVRAIGLQLGPCTGRLPRAWAELGPGLEELSITINGGASLADPSWPVEWRNLTGVKRLSLNGVGVTGALSLGALPPSVERVDLLNNRFTSLADDLAPGALPALAQLAIGQDPDHRIRGTLPASWSTLAALQSLDLRSQALTGPLPPAWPGMAALRELRLSGNALSGPLPAKLPPNVLHLDLSHNQLTGRLDAWEWWNDTCDPVSTAGSCEEKRALFLAHNQLTGALPEGPAGRAYLVDLSDNALTSTLPAAWAHWASNDPGSGSQAVMLNLAGNQLRGPLPPEWGNWTWPAERDWLHGLNLTGNPLNATLPPEWGSLNLWALDASFCSLRGELPAAWAPIRLSALAISDNPDLSGCLPRAWLQLEGFMQLLVHPRACELPGDCATGALSLPTVHCETNPAKAARPGRSAGLARTRLPASHAQPQRPRAGAARARTGGGGAGAAARVRPGRRRGGARAQARPAARGRERSRSLLDTAAAPSKVCKPGTGVTLGAGKRGTWCRPCKAGTWSAGGLNAKCKACRQGYKTVGGGASSCSDCRGGYGLPLSAGNATNVCEPCPAGTWRDAKPGEGIQPCNACPPLTTTAGPGAKSVAACNQSLALPDDPLASALLRGAAELGPQLSDTLDIYLGQQPTGRLPRAWAELGPGLESLYITINSQGSEQSGLSDASWPVEWRNLTGLKRLRLDGVGVTGALSLAALPPSVQSVTLYNNRLTSLADDLMGGALPALDELIIQQDPASYPIGGTLPASWGALAKLWSLDLRRQALTGPLPEAWSGMVALQDLRLSGNALSGPLPASWGGGMAALTSLNLSGNALSGPLPAAWGDGMAALTSLNLSGNALGGPLPASWGAGMAALMLLDLSHNAITGRLPDAWRMAKLSWLDLSRNSISGPIPEAVTGGLVALGTLDLSHNALSGSLPARAFSNVGALDLSYNQLTGRIKDWARWTTLASCFTVNFAHNQLTGPLPEVRWDGPGGIDLSDNALTSTLPAAWVQRAWTEGDCGWRVDLNLAGNQLRGPLPPEWGAWTLDPYAGLGAVSVALASLNLTGNPLNATLPPEWGNITSLGSLDVRSCGLSGIFPAAEWAPMRPDRLGISDNPDLSGCLPRAWLKPKGYSSLLYYQPNCACSMPVALSELASGKALDPDPLRNTQIVGICPA
ncbi:HISN4 [Scenedesmus sp. PABB004]|nr:HISN4 [Scenedesmus sp. PABB004]